MSNTVPSESNLLALVWMPAIEQCSELLSIPSMTPVVCQVPNKGSPWDAVQGSLLPSSHRRVQDLLYLGSGRRGGSQEMSVYASILAAGRLNSRWHTSEIRDLWHDVANTYAIFALDQTTFKRRQR